MKFSLLSNTPEKISVECSDLLYNLSIDRAVNAAISDSRRAEYFLGILAKPLTEPENIKYRQEISPTCRPYPIFSMIFVRSSQDTTRSEATGTSCVSAQCQCRIRQ